MSFTLKIIFLLFFFRERLQKLQTSLKATKSDFMTVAENDIPNLIQECKEAKVLRILTGDYDLKLVRQDYFTSNQDKVCIEFNCFPLNPFPHIDAF